MKKNIKIWLCLLIVLCLIFSMYGCSTSATEETVEVNIAYFPNVTHAQALILKSQGTLEADWEGTATVNWVSFNSGTDEIEALFSGDIDIGYIGPVPAISANVQSDGDVQILTGASEAGAMLVVSPDSDIESVADLDGKTIAVPSIGNTQYLCLLELLSENGLASTDDGGTVNIVAVSNSDVASTMEQGSIDGALVPEPWGTALVEDGAEILLDETEVFMDGDYPVALVVVRKDFYEEYPELVEEFLEEHEAATVYINENTEDAEDLVNEEIYEVTQTSLSDTELEGAFSRITFDTDLNTDALDAFAETCLEQGLITSLPDSDLLIGE